MERLCRDEDMAQGGGAAMRMSDEDLFLVFASKELVLLVVSTLERSRVAQVPLSMKGLKRRRIQRKMLYLRLLSKGALFSCSNPSSKRGELSTSSALAAAGVDIDAAIKAAGDASRTVTALFSALCGGLKDDTEGTRSLCYS